MEVVQKSRLNSKMADPPANRCVSVCVWLEERERESDRVNSARAREEREREKKKRNRKRFCMSILQARF